MKHTFLARHGGTVLAFLTGFGLGFVSWYQIFQPEEIWLTVLAVALRITFLLTLWWLLRRLLRRRLRKVVAATDRLAEGLPYTSPGLQGNDEVAVLSRALDRMACELMDRNDDLKEANGRMKQEITERRFVEEALRNSERRFRSIWENSADAMRLTDSKGTILAVNPAFCRLVNLPAEDLVQEPYTIAYHKQEESGLERYRQRFAARTIDQFQEREIVFRCGRKAHLEMTFSFVELRSQKPLLLGIFRNVTERKRHEEQRIVLERKLLDSQKLESLGVLAGGIAHDFNNLLTAILGNATLARFQTEDPTLQNHLTNIEKTSLRAAELCKQMLAYSGRGRFTLEYIHINEVARETAELLEVSISKKSGLQLDLREPLPTIFADPAQVRQILMNLVINASEALGENSGMIRVKTGVVQADAACLAGAHMPENLPEGEYCVLEVSDNGCGMDAETQARIFDPFFTTKFTGRGLGLAAVLGIVRSHKGALRLKSAPGAGTTFTVMLPVAYPPAPPTATPGSITTKALWRSEGTILVADDDPNVRAITSRLVESCGFKVLQAVDGRHAVDVFSKNRAEISAVLLDVTMPQLNGDEAFREMKRIDPDVKVLMVSGYSREEDPQRFQNGKPNGFLQKPFRSEELTAKLRGVLMQK